MYILIILYIHYTQVLFLKTQLYVLIYVIKNCQLCISKLSLSNVYLKKNKIKYNH